MSTSITELIGSLYEAFSDFRIVVEEIIDARGEDGNGMVGVQAKMRGVHTGELFGITPTGRETGVRMHDFHEIVMPHWLAGSGMPPADAAIAVRDGA